MCMKCVISPPVRLFKPVLLKLFSLGPPPRAYMTIGANPHICVCVGVGGLKTHYCYSQTHI